MGVGPFLAGGIYAGASMLIKAGPFTDAPVGLDRERGNTSTSVIGHKQHFAGLINHQVARPASPGVHFVEKCEGARLTIDGVAADRAIFLVAACSGLLTHLSRGIHKAMLWIGGHEGRIRLLGGHANRGELSTMWIKLVVINPFARS